MQQFEILQSQFNKEIRESTSSQKLEMIRVKYLGKKGIVKTLLNNIKNLSPDKRKEFGIKLNAFKKEVETMLSKKHQELSKGGKNIFFDITLPGKRAKRGSLHMITLAINEIIDIFKPLGFIRMSYPEVEWEYFAFDALNMPKIIQQEMILNSFL